ncbi:MAG TPA: hypothetical protein VFW47_03120 [Phenylobacterium sp.]|nr:hypothetical protein [Phenylobacterium sp.]
MTAILYPVATDAETALSGPVGRAAREREAGRLAGEGVTFASGLAGPAYATREAALDALAGRVDDERPGRGPQVAIEDRFCRLVEVAQEGRPPRAVKPVLKDGRRWPAPPAERPKTVWRLQVSYWRPLSAAPELSAAQAREARRKAREPVDPQSLRALTRQPLRPVKPQQPLDIGLFEVRLPESPHIVVPDE